MCSLGWIRKHRAARMYIVVLSSEYFPYLSYMERSYIENGMHYKNSLDCAVFLVRIHAPIDPFQWMWLKTSPSIRRVWLRSITLQKKHIIRGLTVIYIFCTLFCLFFVSTQKQLLSSRYKPSFWLFGKFGKSGQKSLHTRASLGTGLPCVEFHLKFI